MRFGLISAHLFIVATLKTTMIVIQRIVQRPVVSVLEVGCSTGVFYERLGFSKAERYLGIDILDSVLDEFREIFSHLS